MRVGQVEGRGVRVVVMRPIVGNGAGSRCQHARTRLDRVTVQTDRDRTRHRLLLLDGHSLAYRAFYALPVENFSTTTGQPTNAVYGFTSMLINVLRDENPTHVAVAFDVSRSTFRSELFAEYKANRSASPTDFKGQVDLVKEVLEALRIPSLRGRGLRGRRRHRDRDRAGRARGLRRPDLHRRPRRAAAGLRPGHGALPAQGRLGHVAVHARVGAGEVRPEPGAVPRLRRAARRPERQPAQHPERGGEDRDQVDRGVRRPRPAGRPGRRGQGQGRRRAARPPGPGGAEPPAHRAGPRRPDRGDARRPGAHQLGARRGAPGLRHPGVPGAARPALRHRRGGDTGGRRGLRGDLHPARAGRGRAVAGRARPQRRADRRTHLGVLGRRGRRRHRGRAGDGRRRGRLVRTRGPRPGRRAGGRRPGWPTSPRPRRCTTRRARRWRSPPAAGTCAA